VTAAVLASRLGVYGTVIGAGVVSVVATCGGSLFQHFFSRTGEQLREAGAQARPARHGRAPRARRADAADGVFTTATMYGTRVRGWKRPVAAAVVVFGVAMTAVTGYELASGKGLGGAGGTTVGSAVRGGGPHSTPSRTPSPQTPDSGDEDAAEGRSGDGRDGDGTPDGEPAPTADPESSPSPSPSPGTGRPPGSGAATTPSANPSESTAAGTGEPSGGASAPAGTAPDGTADAE
jgi:hypothetical protein